jgi:hypothetical protein
MIQARLTATGREFALGGRRSATVSGRPNPVLQLIKVRAIKQPFAACGKLSRRLTRLAQGVHECHPIYPRFCL